QELPPSADLDHEELPGAVTGILLPRASSCNLAGRHDGSPISPRIKQLRLRPMAPAMTSARASASPARLQGPVWMFSLNRNTPSRPADSGSRTVNPGCDAASGPAASACEASSIAAAPTTRSAYSDQVVKTAPMPAPRCELSSLMIAATKP